MLLHRTSYQRVLPFLQRVSTASLVAVSRSSISLTHSHQPSLAASTAPSSASSAAATRYFSSSRLRTRMSAPSSSSSSATSPSAPSVEHLMDNARALITDLIIDVVPTAFPEVSVDAIKALRPDLIQKMAKCQVKGQGDLAVPAFVFSKLIKGVPMKTAETLATALQNRLTTQPNESIVGVKAAGPYVNITMSVKFLASVLEHISSGAYLKPRSKEGHAKVMIEYSQPNCFPSEDHEILTSDGFMTLEQFRVTFAAHGSVQVACPLVDGRLQFHTVSEDALTIADGEFQLVEFVDAPTEYVRTVNGKQVSTSTSHNFSISPTDNHRMYARLGTLTNMAREKFHIHTAGDIAKFTGVQGASQHVQFQCNSPAGAIDAPIDHLPFVSVLDLKTDDQIGAFLELYGYWLGDGWLDMRGRVCFAPVKHKDWSYLDNLFARLSLPILPKSVIGQHGYWRQPSVRAGAQCCFYITGPRWFNYFVSEYGVKYGGAPSTDEAGTLPDNELELSSVMPANKKKYISYTKTVKNGQEHFSAMCDQCGTTIQGQTVQSARTSMCKHKKKCQGAGKDDVQSGAASDKGIALDDEEMEYIDKMMLASHGAGWDLPHPIRQSSFSSAAASSASAVSVSQEENKMVDEVEPLEVDEVAVVDVDGDATIVKVKSAKWFWWWVLRRLGKKYTRALLKGYRFADGDQAGSSESTGWIGTSSVTVRDQLMIAAIRAGHSAYFRLHCQKGESCGTNAQGVEIIARHNHWRVYYSDDDHSATPKLSITEEVKVRQYRGVVWCVTVPTAEQLIIVRRVLQYGEKKEVLKASRPVVVGNTHKAFHVGHMRNAALGDCLVRLHEQVGHEVVAVNYFGDEGAHVAKCLWFLQEWQLTQQGFDIESVPKESRGEWLGAMYSSAVEALDLSSLTTYPFPNIIAAKVLAVNAHPAAGTDAPPNWHVVKLQIDESGKTATVVCGGKGYEVGNLVAYTPVGTKIAKGIVEPKDMKGVMSEGIIMASRELGIEEPTPAPVTASSSSSSSSAASALAKPAKGEKPTKAEKPAKADKAAASASEKKEEKKDDAAAAAAAVAKPAKSGEKKENKGKGDKERDSPNNLIHIFPSSLRIGVPVAELGKKTPVVRTPAEIAADEKAGKYYLPMPQGSVVEEIERRKAATKKMLLTMESGTDAGITALWHKTKLWSLEEFKNIYAWLQVRFDFDFYESECSEPSRVLVEEYRNKVFFDSNGALGADLSQFGLGFAMVLKSDGSGLYATKDLALAKRKFDEFGIDTSIYIVDAAQTLHFKQVFKVLEQMGYERAKNCVHIPYGQVVLPDGKMSSRKGTVILFSQLRNLLNDDIYSRFLKKFDPDVPAEDVTTVVAAPSTAAVAPATSTSTSTAVADVSRVWVKQDKDIVKWSREEIDLAKRQISVAVIKYGMLNHDVTKDIVFVLSEWTSQSGNTGVYMMYAYARGQKIVREIQVAPTAKVNFSLLTHEAERNIISLLHDMWDVIERTTELKNPSTLCNYIFSLAQSFSSWYEVPECSVKDAASEDLKATRIEFLRCITKVIKLGMNLLGIQTLERM